MPLLLSRCLRASRWVVLAAWLLQACTGQAEVIRVVSPDYWCPYSCKAGSPAEGYIVDLLRVALERHGHSLKYENVNYARALQDARHGGYALITTVYPEEAPGFVFTQEPVSRASYCFYTRPENPWRFAGSASLAGMHVGVINGYSYGAQMNALIKREAASFEVQSGDTLTQRLAVMVSLKRLDSFIEDHNVVRYLLKSQPELQLKEAGCVPQNFTYMALSPALAGSPALARVIDAEIRNLRRSGQLKEILARYGLSDWVLP
jgi:polar amino acid transport system substrate-binding protein